MRCTFRRLNNKRFNKSSLKHNHCLFDVKYVFLWYLEYVVDFVKLVKVLAWLPDNISCLFHPSKTKSSNENMKLNGHVASYHQKWDIPFRVIFSLKTPVRIRCFPIWWSASYVSLLPHYKSIWTWHPPPRRPSSHSLALPSVFLLSASLAPWIMNESPPSYAFVRPDYSVAFS